MPASSKKRKSKEVQKASAYYRELMAQKEAALEAEKKSKEHDSESSNRSSSRRKSAGSDFYKELMAEKEAAEKLAKEEARRKEGRSRSNSADNGKVLGRTSPTSRSKSSRSSIRSKSKMEVVKEEKETKKKEDEDEDMEDEDDEEEEEKEEHEEDDEDEKQPSKRRRLTRSPSPPSKSMAEAPSSRHKQASSNDMKIDAISEVKAESTTQQTNVNHVESLSASTAAAVPRPQTTSRLDPVTMASAEARKSERKQHKPNASLPSGARTPPRPDSNTAAKPNFAMAGTAAAFKKAPFGSPVPESTLQRRLTKEQLQGVSMLGDIMRTEGARAPVQPHPAQPPQPESPHSDSDDDYEGDSSLDDDSYQDNERSGDAGGRAAPLNNSMMNNPAQDLLALHQAQLQQQMLQRHFIDFDPERVEEENQNLEPSRVKLALVLLSILAILILIIVAIYLIIVKAIFPIPVYIAENTNILPAIGLSHSFFGLKDRLNFKAVCFADSPLKPGEKAMDYEIPAHCIDAIRVPCPEHAVCRGTVIESCDESWHLEISPDKDDCMLTQNALNQIGQIKKVLHRWNVDQRCNHMGNPHFVENDKISGRPLFYYQKILKETELPFDMKLLRTANREENAFLLDSIDAEILVGLHSSIPIKIPLICRGKKLLKRVFGFLGRLLVSLAVMFVSTLWQTFKNAPMLSTIVTIVGGTILSMMHVVRAKKEAKRQLELDIINLRQRVYEELSAQVGSSTPAHIICERIVWKDHPSSRAKRERISKVIWPYVADDIRSDNRVSKTSRQAQDGKVCDHWQWMDTPIQPVGSSNTTGNNFSLRQRSVRIMQ